MKSEFAMCSLALRLFGRRFPGNYVATEGLVASGKSTLARGLYENNVLNPNEFWPIHEPGTTAISEGIRNLVQGNLSQNEKVRQGLSPRSSFMLYSAARASLFDTSVLPGLKAGKSYFSDRGWPSSWAYQGAEGVPLWFIFFTSMQITEWLIPNLILYVDIPVNVALERRLKKGELDRYDVRTSNYFEKVRANYLALSGVFRGLGVWESIDGTKSVETVVDQAARVLRAKKLVK